MQTSADDDAMLAQAGVALGDAVERALPAWVEACVHRVGPQVAASDVAAAVDAAVESTVPRLRALLALDVDAQTQSPLALLRTAARFPTAVLRCAGAPPVERDDVQRRLFPDDVYDLVPARFADLGPEVGEAGLLWGATKAHVHRRRHLRSEN